MEIDSDGGLVIDTDGMDWRELAPGVGIKVLRLNRASDEWTIMIRSEAGSVLPPHQHIGNSEIYVIKGSGHHEQAGHFKTGDYVLEPDGATHSPVFFQEEVVQIMFAKGPSQFLDENGNKTFLMDVNMLSAFADESVLALA